MMLDTAGRPLRRDASRNRDRIVQVARDALDAGRPLQFNEIARTAEVGIGTVYRHFDSPEALREAAVLPGLEALAEAVRPLGAEPDAWRAFSGFVRAAVVAQRDDPALAAVTAQPTDALPRTAAVRAELGALFARLIETAASSGALRRGVGVQDVSALLCGTAYAIRITHATGGDDSTDRYLDVLLAGLHTGSRHRRWPAGGRAAAARG